MAYAAITKPSLHFNTVLYTGTGAAQRIGGYINRGAVFNGSSSRINIADGGIGASGTARETFSISLWVRVTSASLAGIINDYNTHYSFAVELQSNGTIKVLNNFSGNVNQTTGSTNIDNGSWHHLVLVNNTGDNTQKLYLNGNSTPEINQTLGTGTKSASEIAIGHYLISGSASLFLNGQIDQIRFFNKALSTSEVATLNGETHSSTTISTTDIFDDDSGVALFQLDGNANDTGGVSGRLDGTESAIFSESDSNFKLENNTTVPSGSLNTVINNNFGISFWAKS